MYPKKLSQILLALLSVTSPALQATESPLQKTNSPAPTAITLSDGPRTLHICQSTIGLLTEDFDDGYLHKTSLPIHFSHGWNFQQFASIPPQKRPCHIAFHPSKTHPKRVFIGPCGLQGGGGSPSKFDSDQKEFNETVKKTKEKQKKLIAVNKQLKASNREIQQNQKNIATLTQEIVNPNHALHEEQLLLLLDHTRQVDNTTTVTNGLQKEREQLKTHLDNNKKRLQQLKGSMEEFAPNLLDPSIPYYLRYPLLSLNSLFVGLYEKIYPPSSNDKNPFLIDLQKKIEEVTQYTPFLPPTAQIPCGNRFPTPQKATHQRLQAIEKRAKWLQEHLGLLKQIIHQQEQLITEPSDLRQEIHHFNVITTIEKLLEDLKRQAQKYRDHYYNKLKECQKESQHHKQTIKILQQTQAKPNNQSKIIAQRQKELEAQIKNLFLALQNYNFSQVMNAFDEAEAHLKCSRYQLKKIPSLKNLSKTTNTLDKAKIHLEHSLSQLEKIHQKIFLRQARSLQAITKQIQRIKNILFKKNSPNLLYLYNLQQQEANAELALRQLAYEKIILQNQLPTIQNPSHPLQKYRGHTLKELTDQMKNHQEVQSDLSIAQQQIEQHIHAHDKLLENPEIAHSQPLQKLLQARNTNLQSQNNHLALQSEIHATQENNLYQTIQSRIARAQTTKIGLSIIGGLGITILCPRANIIFVTAGSTCLGITGQKIVENNLDLQATHQEILSIETAQELATAIVTAGVTQYIGGHLPTITKKIGQKLLTPEKVQNVTKLLQTLQTNPETRSRVNRLLGNFGLNYLQATTGQTAATITHHTIEKAIDLFGYSVYDLLDCWLQQDQITLPPQLHNLIIHFLKGTILNQCTDTITRSIKNTLKESQHILTKSTASALAGTLINEINLPTSTPLKTPRTTRQKTQEHLTKSALVGLVTGILATYQQHSNHPKQSDNPKNNREEHLETLLAGFLGGALGHLGNNLLAPLPPQTDKDPQKFQQNLNTYSRNTHLVNYTTQLASLGVALLTRQNTNTVLDATIHQTIHGLFYNTAHTKQKIAKAQQELQFKQFAISVCNKVSGPIIDTILCAPLGPEGIKAILAKIPLEELQKLSKAEPRLKLLCNLLAKKQITTDDKIELLRYAEKHKSIFTQKSTSNTNKADPKHTPSPEEILKFYACHIRSQERERLRAKGGTLTQDEVDAYNKQWTQMRQIANIPPPKKLTPSEFCAQTGKGIYSQFSSMTSKEGIQFIGINTIRYGIVRKVGGGAIGGAVGGAIGGAIGGPLGAVLGRALGRVLSTGITVYFFKKTIENVVPEPKEKGRLKETYDLFVKTPTSLEVIYSTGKEIYKVYQVWPLLDAYEKQQIHIQISSAVGTIIISYGASKTFNKIKAKIRTLKQARARNNFKVHRPNQFLKKSKVIRFEELTNPTNPPFHPKTTYQAVPQGNTLTYVEVATKSVPVLKVVKGTGLKHNPLPNAVYVFLNSQNLDNNTTSTQPPKQPAPPQLPHNELKSYNVNNSQSYLTVQRKSSSTKFIKPKNGRFQCPKIERQYQKYIKRNSSRNKPIKNRPDWQQARQKYHGEGSPIKRGNAFNEKANTDGWYEFHEIHLENGKYLDSYSLKNGGEIVSRKSIYLDQVPKATFKGYLRELTTKYKAGTKVRSRKYTSIFKKKGITTIQGQYILEIPDINRFAQNLSYYKELAKKFTIVLRFRPE